MKTMFVYDNTGKIYHWAQGDFVEPVGLPYLIIEDYDYEVRPIERIDVSVEPHVPVYGLSKEEAKFKAMTLDEYKAYKIEESIDLLKGYLENHPLYSTVHNIDGGYYNVTQDKQNLMMSNYMSYHIELATNPEAVLTWNETGKSCEVWTQEEFMQLILEIKAYVKPKVSAQQKYEELITVASSKEEVEAIDLSYEDAETEET